MKTLTLPVIALIGLSAFAQVPQTPQTPPPASSDVPELGMPAKISVSVTNIVAPTLVTDRNGNIVDGLKPAQFHLFDNGKEQNIQVDVTFEPISVVLAIEASSRVEAILPQLRHLGSLMPLVAGDHGEVAVMAFDSRLRVLQDFTPDADKVKAAIDKINAGNPQSRMIDAVEKAVFMLRNRPKDNRKIVLLVSETRDMSSEAKVRETLIDAQLQNVLVYTVDISQLAVRLTEKREEPRPNPIDFTGQTLPMGQVATPTTMTQSYSAGSQAQFVPVLKEIYTDAKRIFVENPTEIFSKGTGGNQFAFIKQRGLEDAIQRISQEIRSQYLISYTPNNKGEPGFHEISVVVERTQYIAKTRPGYWLGGGNSQ
jgi:VWFA-related protein